MLQTSKFRQEPLELPFLAIARTITLATALASDMREFKANIREMKADKRNLNAGLEELLRLFRNQKSS
ncbi:hypothetical protein LC653_06710 [Nostoc sp. CHAB 5784]|uniref:hypothetical protein n=1 Tax=Nostoc mirabile TaxID=2907820 RepID=UPI001E5517B7|nr:hypothetical protein [Nostoc mirabile]MCC5663625.1 hypothetical protein [Nostoc mirabile CHAB5784]